MAMTDLDVGFFEPFRNNIIEFTSDGFFKIKVPRGLMIDKNTVLKYFDDPVLSFQKESVEDSGISFFSGYAKTDEIREILFTMSFNFSVKIEWPEPFNQCDGDLKLPSSE